MDEYWDTVIKPLIDEKNKLCLRFQRDGWSPALDEMMDEINVDLMEYPEYRRSHGRFYNFKSKVRNTK